MSSKSRAFVTTAATLMLLTTVASFAPAPAQAKSRHHHRAHAAKSVVEPEFKPQGPLTIIVSISKQRLTLYDGMKPVTTTMVSTGVAGHETPTGIFTVIQKDRFHRSNIYSDAPMPFMQRITWSGVALHEGHVTGRPASHGCIRLPQAFAMKLWKITKLGVRVIVANEDVSLAEFDAPEIFMPKPAVASETPDTKLPVATAQPPAASEKLTAAAGAPAAQTSDRAVEPAHAEAKASVATEIAVQPADIKNVVISAGQAADDVKPHLAEAVVPTSESVVAKNDANEATLAAAPRPEPAPDSASAPAPTVAVTISPETNPNSIQLAATQTASTPDPTAPAADAPKPFVLDKSAGPLSIFISKRDGKLYVRQNFKPVYETKISFLPEAPALGTHVYTLLSPIAPATPMKWSVATVPSSISLQRERERVALKLRQTAKRHLPQVPVQATMTNEPILTPQTALTQVQIPDEARNIIFAALTPASSLIVSDLGLGSETGKGTEFIVQAK